MRLLCGLPLLGTPLTLLLSALLHAYDAFEFVWEHRRIGVADRFALIEQARQAHDETHPMTKPIPTLNLTLTLSLPSQHWLYFLGYGGVLASLSIHLRFVDLYAIRASVYPLYMANAPHATFATTRVHRALPVFQMPLFVFNGLLQLAALRLGARL